MEPCLKSNSLGLGPPSDHPMNILIVDDDDDLRGGLAANLRDDGHNVREFSNSLELPPLNTIKDVDVVISDYQMAGKDGLMLADEFHYQHPNIPFVLITAYWSQHLESAAAQRKFLHLCRKPFDYDQLHSLLVKLS